MGGQKYTYEYVVEYCKNLGYKVLDKGYNHTSKLTLEDEYGYKYYNYFSKIKQGVFLDRYSKSNIYTIYNIKLYINKNIKDFKLMSEEYNGSKDKLLFKCDKGHEFKMVWNHLKLYETCPVCSNHQIVKGYNDIATTDPWMVKYLKNKRDAYLYASQSNQKVNVICPDCNKEKEIKVCDIYRNKSIACNCSDDAYYTEKFIACLLEQLHLQYKKEYKSQWSNNKRYDFYFEHNNSKIIIECHGRQHYENKTFEYVGGRTLDEEQQNDLYKKELALNNNINEYIVLDCRKSNLDWIKNSILNSNLNEIFDLSNIDWMKCDEFALSNIVKEVCDYWHLHNEINNENLSTKYLAKEFNLAFCTISRYLKKGNMFGWCNYNPKEEQSKYVLRCKQNPCAKPILMKNELEKQYFVFWI